MDYELKMPDLSAASDEVKISEWYFEEGQTVQRGEAMLSVETDKVQMDVESVVSGRIKRILFSDDQTVVTGQIIAIIEVEQGPKQRNPIAPKVAESADPSVVSRTPDSPAADPPPDGRKGMFHRNRQRLGDT